LRPSGTIPGDPLYSGVTLKEFAAWCIKMNWTIPQELAEIAAATADPVVNASTQEKKEQGNVELGTRERDTVLRIIAGFLAQGFTASDISKPYAVAKEIQKALQASGIELSDDTIAKWIKEASPLLSASEKSPTKS